VEQVVLPDQLQHVDIIISEWMGYFLLFESMLPTVLYARDKWLASDGGVYPNKADMLIAGFEASHQNTNKVDFWKDVYGFDMSCLIEETERTNNMGSEVIQIEAKSLMTNTDTLLNLNIGNVQDRQLDFLKVFSN